MKEKVYIIGGSGFIGKHLCVSLSSYYNVTVFDKWIDLNYFSQYPDINTFN
jgi:nucleoside-diphosphate-sugar epimerase